MKKAFLVVVLFLIIPLISKAQTPIYVGYYDAGLSGSAVFTDVDSAITYASEWFDGTMFDGQTIYLHAYYYNSSSVADTLAKLTIEGNSLINKSTYTNTMIDTLDMVSQTASVNSSNGAYTQIAVSRIPASGVIQHITLTPTAANSYPLWRLKVTGGSNNAILVLTWYAKVNDYVPTAQHFSGVRP